MLINKQKTLEMVCGQLREAAANGASIAFDTEFVSERRYSPRLCLVQVFCELQPGPIQAIIDPFAVDLMPLIELIADPQIVKILHAGGQDLQILWTQFNRAAANVFDTQIAAAFLGYGHQAGYVDLVRRVIDGPSLSKTQQFTDWSTRPLSHQQVEYALDDVRYLPAMYATLSAALNDRRRFDWAQSEFRRAEIRATETTPPEELFRKFNLAGMSRRQTGHLRELTATRETIAREIDKPPTFLVPDATLLQMAKQPPSDLNALRSLRGMPRLADEHARELLDAVARVAKMDEDELPKILSNSRPDPRAETVSALLGVVTQLRADECEISRSYLASREQLVALSSWWLKNDNSPPPPLPLLEGWRRELIGEEILQLLSGKLLIGLDATARDRGEGGRNAPRNAYGNAVVRVISSAVL